nr:reverse transcriptase domain-containing protein [Tanacetum cinerariifolium]
MCTRSSSNLVGESSPSPATSNLKRRNRRRSKQPFILEESLVDTMTDQRTMAELLRAPTEGYAEAIVIPPILAEQFELKHSLINMMTSDQFFVQDKDNPRDHIRTARRWLKKELRVPFSLGKILFPNSSMNSSLPQERQIFEIKFPIFNNATPPLASVKAVEEMCVSCGGAHPYYQCLAADGNTFLEFLDNIQGYVSAAAVNYNQVVPLSELEKIKKMNEINIRAMQTQSNIMKNELRNEMKTSIQASMSNQTNELKNMMASFFQMNTASTLGLGPFPSNTIANPKQLYINITLADALILIPKYQKMLKALLSNKEKLSELANTPLNENCSAIILKKLPMKLRDPGKFLISCCFSELKCKALADLGASINLMPLSVWKKLGLPELIFTRMTLELANRAICTPAGIARDVFVPVGKFAFPADFVIVNYESDPRVPLILGRPFLWTARALIDVHGEEMILHDGDERLTLNMRHDTSSYLNQPQKESINMINIYNDSCEDYLEDLFTTNHLSGNPTFSFHTDLTSPEVINPLSGSTTSFSLDQLLEEFSNELALITFSPRNDDLPFDIESDLREIEYFLNHDPTKEIDSILEDSIDEKSKLLIDELDPPRSSDFLPSLEYDSFLFEDFSKVDALPSTNNEEKVFNSGILIQENLFEDIVQVTPDKNVKKISISNVSLILEDFDPPLYELPFHKEVPRSETLLSISSENEEKVFKPEILTSKGVHTSFLSELSH